MRHRYTDLDELMRLLGIAEDCDNCSEKMKAYCDMNPDFAFTCQMISDAPVYDVIPVRHGEWIDRGDGLVYCSKCTGFQMASIKDDINANFCPRCGAFMRGNDGKND